MEGAVTNSFEMINGTPNYNLYINGEWTRSAPPIDRPKARTRRRGELFARVQQAGKAETEQAISAAHGAYKAWDGFATVSEQEDDLLQGG